MANYSGTGTKEDPWVLRTPPGTSEYQMYLDDAADPPAIICQVGGTQLKYDKRAIDDLHAMLKAQGDWMPLGGADEQKPAPEGSVEAWGRAEDNPLGGWYGLKKGLRGRFGVYMPPLMEALVEPPQGLGRIGERRPVTDGIREARHLGEVGRDGVVGYNLAQATAEDLAVAQVWAALQRRFRVGVLLEQLLVGGLGHAARSEDRTHAREDPGLPVDERAVAIEGQCLETSVVELGHRRSLLLWTR